jgi:integrase
MYAATGNYPYDLFVRLAILTGARLGEMLGLKLSDIDFLAGTISIQRTLGEKRAIGTDGKLAPTFSPPKTSKSIRALTFGEQLGASLLRHKGQQDSAKRLASEKWIESDCVFTT